VTQLSSSATRRPSSCSLTCAPQHEATPQSMTKQDAAQVSMVQLIMSWLSNSWLSNSWLSNSWLSNSWLSNSWLSNSWLSITQHSLITQTRCISDTHFLDDSDAHSITAKEVPTRLSRGQDGVFVVSVDTLCMDMLHRHEWTDSRCLLDAHMPSHTPDGAVPPA
jgi:hypothetical protein